MLDGLSTMVSILLMRKSNRAFLEQFMGRLSPRQRKTTCMRYGLGQPPHTLTEIGKEMGITKQAVAASLYAAQKKMLLEAAFWAMEKGGEEIAT